MGAVLATSANASTLQEPGYIETVIGSITEATNGFGGMTTDSADNLYFAANRTDQVYRWPPGGPFAQFGTISGDDANGVAIIGTTLYSSTTNPGQVFAQNLAEVSPVGALVAAVPGAMGMEVAPAGFGAFGGQLIVGTTTGVVALDAGTGTVTPIWATGTVPDVAFTLDGRLLALPANGQIVEVAADGTTSIFASGLGAADGIAVHPSTGEIFVADPSSQSIVKVSADGTTSSPFATDALVDGGFFPSPITFTVDGASLFYGTRESGTTVYRIDGFEGLDGSGTLLVQVTKTFSNGDTGDVEVTLTCNGGIPLEQSFTISGGGAGVTFTVTSLPDTGADCEVTETGGNEGYTADLGACSWTGLTGGARSCAITNVPDPTTIAVDTTIMGADDPGIDDTFTTTVVCSNVSPDSGADNFGTYTATDTSGMFEVDWYAEPGETAACTATMVPNSMAVEGADCAFSFALGDEEAGCALEGTVFFEGIPTLGQYGMALMALLMLGIGFVGLRRFV
jgi:sugar lactone lactonase YvrE